MITLIILCSLGCRSHCHFDPEGRIRGTNDRGQH